MVYNLEKAKKDSIEKWNIMLKNVNKLIKNISTPCGFCILNRNNRLGTCLSCLVSDKCVEMGNKITKRLWEISIYIGGDLIPFIENVREDEK